jgi:hypothetical protein
MPPSAQPPLEKPGAYLPPRPWLPRAVALLAVTLALLAGAGMYLAYRPLPFSPTIWQTSLGSTRGRMLKSLLAQTNFVGFPRSEVELYLGSADFDDRLIWYDLGPVQDDSPVDPRAAIGDPGHLYGVFAYDQTGTIKEVLYNHRRPTLGSQSFDSTGWFGGDPLARRAMFLRALAELRGLGMTRSAAVGLLGVPAGERVHGQYDVGRGGKIFSAEKALILEYTPGDTVQASHVDE